MESIYYIGLDVHKKTIAYCIKTANGTKVRQGVVAAERKALGQWLTELPGPWLGALEATIFTGWIYDFLKPHAVELKVAHPERKADRDAGKLCKLFMSLTGTVRGSSRSPLLAKESGLFCVRWCSGKAGVIR